MKERGMRKALSGVVVSDKMDKTVVVKVERSFMHSAYFKTVKKIKKYKAHDEGNVCKVGDRVLIEETRPISKDKYWKIKEIVEKAA